MTIKLTTDVGFTWAFSSITVVCLTGSPGTILSCWIPVID